MQPLKNQIEFLTYNLKALRNIYNFTQGTLAGLLGIERSTYSYYELGKTLPSIEMLARLSKIYRVPIEYFLSPPLSGRAPPEELFRFTPNETNALGLFRLLDSANKDVAIQVMKRRLELQKTDLRGDSI